MEERSLEEEEEEEEEEEKLTMKHPTQSKKRTFTEEVHPVLIRLHEGNTFCPPVVYINKDQVKIGRSLDNDVVIKSVLISRYHCILENDKDNGNWYVTNLSSTDTLLNNELMERSKTKIIKDNDILQLSLSTMFTYRFTIVKKDEVFTKLPRLISDNYKTNCTSLDKISFVESQTFQRECLEKQIFTNQEEQELMKKELKKLLQDREETKTCTEKLNNKITELQKKIEFGKSVELELQQKHKVLLKELEDERLEFEKKLQEEKNIQIKLQDEKHVLEQKLIEMEKTLEEKMQPKTPISPQSQDIKECSVVIVKEIKRSFRKKSKPKIIYDLTKDDGSSLKNCQNGEILTTVNHIMDEQLTCSICSELFINAVTLNCTHTFCRFCIDSWKKRRNDCPNCRSSIETTTRSLVLDNFIENILESLTPEQMQKRNLLIQQRKNLSKYDTRRKFKKKR